MLDTPGILDKPLEQRNTIEMQAVTALAHLQCSVLYFVDLSETCGWSIQQQADLFNNIRPLFLNKPLVIVCNKTDLQPAGTLPPEKRRILEAMGKVPGASLVYTSTATGEGVMDLKKVACDMLLEARVNFKASDRKMRMAGVINRLAVVEPTRRDHKQRASCIPESGV